ncbi:MAG TPA: ABC transporter permease [Thermoanaerobaculia bacterium]|nr:ABC transporter permease [Thermoanaerobaculia bacterium]
MLCMALAIGSASAIWSVVHAILLRPLPLLRDAGRLVMLYDAESTGGTGSAGSAGGDGLTLSRVTPFNYASWKEQTRDAFAGMEAMRLRSLHLTGDGEPLQLRGTAVTAGLFPLLGAAPRLGRGFLPEEDRPGAPAAVVLLGHGLWQTLFHGDPAAVGRTLLLNGHGHQIVGVMPAGFQFPEGQDFPGGSQLWIPAGLDPAKPASRTDHVLFVAARLAPGRTLAQARRELAAVSLRLARDAPASNLPRTGGGARAPCLCASG